MVALRVDELLRATPPTLGPGRLVCIDGPAGSGKSTLAGSLEAPGRTVVHTDEMLEGWTGLPGLPDAVARLVEPLSRGEDGRWRRWDWVADGWAETQVVRPGGVLVLEGTGSWSPRIAGWVTVLVWVEAESRTRLARGLARDGEAARPHWDRWRVAEAQHLAENDTRAHAHLLVNTDA